MLEKILKKSSWADIAISLIFILFGIMLISSPETIQSIIAILLGAIFIIMGVFKVIDYIATNREDNYLLAIAIVAFITGLIIMFCSNIIISVFRILIAIWIIYSGIVNLQTTIVWKEYKSKLWITTLILSILMIFAGIYVLTNAGSILQTTGIIIVCYGVINIIESVIFIKKMDNFIK